MVSSMTPTMISHWMEGLGEDDGHDAGVVDAQGHGRALAAIGLAVDDALGVLDGDLALGLGPPPCPMHPGFGQSGSSSAKGQFSNDWKIFFQWLENFAHFFQ